MIAELLHWLGLPGSIVSAIIVFYALYHARDIFLFLSRVGTMVWLATIGVGIFVAAVFAMPGLELSVQISVVVDVLVHLVQMGLDIGGRLVRIVTGLGVLG